MSLDHLVITEIVNETDYPGANAWAVSPDGRYVLMNMLDGMWVLDRTDETYVANFDPGSVDYYNGVAIDNDGTVYGLREAVFVGDPAVLKKIEDFGTGTVTTLSNPGTICVQRTLGLFILPGGAKKLVWADDAIDGAGVKVFDILGSSLSTVANGGSASFHQIVQDSYGDVWAVSGGTSHVYFQRVVDGGEGTEAPNYNAVSVNTADLAGVQVYHSSAGWFVCHNQGKDLYLLDDTDFSVIAYRSYGTGLGNTLNFPLYNQPPFLLCLAPGADSFWFPGPESYASEFGVPAGGYVDVHKINAADLTTLESHYLTDWDIGDTPDPSAGMIYTTNTREALFSMWLGELDPVLRYFDEGDGGEGDNLDTIIRVWSFHLDGHDYYVLRLGGSATLVYDLTTNSWAEWASPDLDYWRAHIGQNWVGMGADTFSNNYGSDIVAGDDTLGILWVLDPSAGLDDDAVTGDPTRYFRRVTGLISVSGRDTIPCGAVTLDLSVGEPTDAVASILLRTSDDLGHSFRPHDTHTLTASDYGAVVEWRALGLIKAPGRVFEFRDNGVSVRISGANLR